MRIPRTPYRPLALVLLGALALAGLPATAAPPDWNAVAGVGTIEIVTSDEDGSSRETKIWLAVVDGQGYARTGDTRWGDNIARNPEVTLRIEGVEYPLRVELIEDEALRERVVQAFRDKYGWSDKLVSIFRSGRPKIMHLLPR
jgi:hypothetical protein